MRLYHRKKDDKLNAINRCFFDAQHGRVSLALDRLEDINDEFPHDAQVAYAEGLIRKDYLGQGIAARELFEKAHNIDNSHDFAACNATKFARDEEEFRKWAQITLKLISKSDPTRQFINNVLKGLDSGEPYWSIIAGGAAAYFEAKTYGDSAALMELTLLTAVMPPDEEVHARRGRAQSIRELDATEHHHRQTLMEAFPTEERLALREALKELEKTIALDEYDPELWNLKSAWCYLLGQHEEAILSADKAIELRPINYPKPYQNKANAFWELKKDKEAFAFAKKALKHAEGCNFAADIAQAKEIVKAYSTQRKSPNTIDIEPLIKHILNAAQITADQEIGQWKGKIDTLVKGVLKRASLIGYDWTMDYVSIMAELLSDFTPETAFTITLNTSKHNQKVHEHCLHAALYVAAHSDGVRQRDAARFLALTFLGAVSIEYIKRSYRQAILETSFAASDELSCLDTIMREELQRINPFFPRLIADQEPINEKEKARAINATLSRFTERPSQIIKQPGRGVGCVTIFIGIVIVFIIGKFITFNN